LWRLAYIIEIKFRAGGNQLTKETAIFQEITVIVFTSNGVNSLF
jgi:hypothetical protein